MRIALTTRIAGARQPFPHRGDGGLVLVEVELHDARLDRAPRSRGSCGRRRPRPRPGRERRHAARELARDPRRQRSTARGSGYSTTNPSASAPASSAERHVDLGRRDAAELDARHRLQPTRASASIAPHGSAACRIGGADEHRVRPGVARRRASSGPGDRALAAARASRPARCAATPSVARRRRRRSRPRGCRGC